MVDEDPKVDADPLSFIPNSFQGSPYSEGQENNNQYKSEKKLNYASSETWTFATLIIQVLPIID